MGDLFAVPYAVLEPSHAYLLDVEDEAVGYVLGTPDTARFVQRFRDDYLPSTTARLPVPPDPPMTPDDFMLALHHTPERMLGPEVAAHPGHLHINLLPDWQGKGWGRRMMATFIDSVRAAGCPAVHLAMRSANTGARPFYHRLGFTELRVDPPMVYFGRDTSPL